jgi:hypothetical protein
VVKELNEKDIEVYFVGLHATILQHDRTGLLGPILEGHSFATMDQAVGRVEATT